MPVGEVLVRRGVEPDRIHRIRDVEQDAVAGTGARRETDGGIHGDVVALIRDPRRLRAGAAVAPLLEPGDRAGRRIGEDARAVDDRGARGRGERHLDHVDAEERRVRVLVRRLARAPGELLARTDLPRARAVDIDVGGVLRVGHQRVRVRSAARLDGGDLLRLADVADVEDADAAEPRRARRLGHPLRAAVDAAARLLDRHEEQVAVDRHVPLPAGAHHRGEKPRLLRRLDVVGIEAVEVADEHVGAAERDIRVGEVQAAAGRRRRLESRFGSLGGGVSVTSWSRLVVVVEVAAGSVASVRARHAAAAARRRDASRRRLRIVEPFGPGHRRDELHAERRVRRVAEARLQPDARVVRDGRRRLVLRDPGDRERGREGQRRSTAWWRRLSCLDRSLLPTDRGEHPAHAVDFHLLVGDHVRGKRVNGRVLRRAR